MTQRVTCQKCNAVYVLPNGQRFPSKCAICNTPASLALDPKTWTCSACGTTSGIAKTSCQGCHLERLTRKKTPEVGRRPPPADDHAKLPRRLRAGTVKPIVSDGD